MDAGRKKLRARSVGGSGLWKRLKRLRFNFNSSHHNRGEVETMIASTLMSTASKVNDDCEKVKRTSVPIPKSTLADVAHQIIASQEITSKQQKLHGATYSLDDGYTSSNFISFFIKK